MEIFVGLISFPPIMLSAKHCKKADCLATTTAVASLAKTSGFSFGGNYNVGVNSSGLLSADAILNPSNILSLFHP
ncbi:MAG: hypothetical protein ACYST3_02230 [Planctomycetota bacterium]|jgi:hypothetical protein